MEDSTSASVERARALARLGRVLKSKYTLDRLLGVGGMGTVYAATHRNGLQVAIKMLHPALSADDSVRARFLREGYAANKVKHPSVVTVLDDDTDDEEGTAFLVLELLEGETAESYAQRQGGRMHPEQVLVLADRVLDVLAAAHAQGVIHRDVKPDNLFLTRDGGLKVFDFGIARLREMSQMSASTTRTGAFLGTPAFMAPEQARGRSEQIDARTDLWALGATMYTLLCGQPVHDADTINELLLAAMTRSPSPLRDVAQDVPIGVAAVVDKALAFDQEARWIDARTMQQAVRALLPESLAAPLDPAGKLPGIQPIVAPIVSDPPRVITEWMPRAGHLTTSRGVAGQPDDLVVPVKGWLSARTVAAAAVAFALGAGVILWMVLARAPVVSSGSLVQSAVGSTPSVSSQDGARVSIEPQDLEGPGASDSDAARTARSRPPASSPIAAHSHGRPDAAAPALPTPSVTVPPLVTTAALPPTQLPAPVPTSTGTGVDWDKRR